MGDFTMGCQRRAQSEFHHLAIEHGEHAGNPMQTGQVLWFGATPKVVEQPQKILDWVNSCAWTSKPITASYTISLHPLGSTERVFAHATPLPVRRHTPLAAGLLRQMVGR